MLRISWLAEELLVSEGLFSMQLVISLVNINQSMVCSRSGAVVTKVRSTGPKGSATSSQGIRGYISVMAALKFFFKFKEYCFVKNNRGTSLTGDVFIWCGR
jgi:hypothetical protein